MQDTLITKLNTKACTVNLWLLPSRDAFIIVGTNIAELKSELAAGFESSAT